MPRDTEKSSASEEAYSLILFVGSKKAEKWLADSTGYEDDHQWL